MNRCILSYVVKHHHHPRSVIHNPMFFKTSFQTAVGYSFIRERTRMCLYAIKNTSPQSPSTGLKVILFFYVQGCKLLKFSVLLLVFISSKITDLVPYPTNMKHGGEFYLQSILTHKKSMLFSLPYHIKSLPTAKSLAGIKNF